MNRQIRRELVNKDSGQKYSVLLNIVTKPIHVDEEASAIDDIVISEQLAPGQNIPDGKYTYTNREEHKNVKNGRFVAQ